MSHDAEPAQESLPVADPAAGPGWRSPLQPYFHRLLHGARARHRTGNGLVLALPVLVLGWLAGFAWLALAAPWPDLDDGLQVLVALLGISLPLFAVWFAWGVFRTARQCLAFLGAPDRREPSLGLDATLAAAPASDRELLGALLAVAWPQLGWRVLAGSTLAMATFGTALALLAPGENLARDWLGLAVAGWLLMVTSGALAALNCVLLWVICGPGTRSGLARNLAAGVQALSQLAWVPLVLALNKRVLASLVGFNPRLLDQWEFGAVAQLIGLSVFLTVAALYFLVRATLTKPELGAWLMLGLLPGLFALGLAGTAAALAVHPIWLGYLASGAGLVGLLDLNAVVFGPAFELTSPLSQQLGAISSTKLLMLLAQAGLVYLLWTTALQAVRRKRQAPE